MLPVRLGPAGIPLSCKGRTIVEGMDDIISLGLETMEVQTVRMIAPQHFEQYWQAGVLANKTEFEMNIHGPYYSELLGDRVERGRSLTKIESTLQAAKTINARHITLHAGHYGDMGRGRAANEQLANVFAGIVDRVHEIWHDDEDIYPVFPWLKDGTPSKIGIETSGRQELWGSLEEVLEVVNHVEGTVPVLNIAHIHSRGHGSMRTSEDYGAPDDLWWLTAGVNFADNVRVSGSAGSTVTAHGVEMFVPWLSLYPEDKGAIPIDASVSIAAVLVNSDGTLLSNQALPPHAEEPDADEAALPGVVHFTIDSNSDGAPDGDLAPEVVR